MHAAVRAAASNLVHREARLRARCDMRSVHALRVAARRLRALLWSMKPWVKRAPYRACTRHLQAISRQLASLRDLDVIRDVLSAQVTVKAGLSAAQRRRMDIDIRRQRADVTQDLRAAMRSARYRQQSRQVLDLLAGPALFRRSLPAGTAPWRQRILKGVDHVDRRAHRAGGKDLHRIRILAKRCRYALEALGPEAPRDTHRRMQGLQALLGRYCDMRLAATWLAEPDSLRDQPLRKQLLRAARDLAERRARAALRVLHGRDGYCG
jgi:CHAD domain-containing protein